MATRWVVPASRPRTRLEGRAWLRTVGRRGPEDWVWPVVALAWLALGWVALTGSFPEVVEGSAGLVQGPPEHSAGGHHHAGTAPDGGGLGPLTATGLHLATWVVMVAATMLPLVAWNLGNVGLRSPTGRRRRATLEVAAGWALVWLVAGMLLAPLLVLAGPSGTAWWTVVGVCALAVGWQLTPLKQVAQARCHRRYAPPLGPSAGRACLRFGRSLGRDCLLSCWPAMLVMSVAGHRLPVVLALGWLAWRDRRRPHDRPGVAVSAAVLVGVGAYALLAQG